MYQVYLKDKVVFESNSWIEVEIYCDNHEWSYTQDTSYAEFEKMMMENMPCDNTGHCSGMSCKNYYNCH